MIAATMNTQEAARIVSRPGIRPGPAMGTMPRFVRSVLTSGQNGMLHVCVHVHPPLLLANGATGYLSLVSPPGSFSY